MHCDDKRTIHALRNYISEVSSELLNLHEQEKTEQDKIQKIKIQNKIIFLEKSLHDSEDQICKMI